MLILLKLTCPEIKSEINTVESLIFLFFTESSGQNLMDLLEKRVPFVIHN